MPALQPMPTFADEVAPVSDDGFGVGPEGIKFRDDIAVKGESVIAGDTITVDYVIKLAETGAIVEKKKSFTFTALKGEVITGFDLAMVGDAGKTMPRMKEGGQRTVLLPAFLAYGRKGRGCKINKDGKVCEVPPNSVLELTINLSKVTRSNEGIEYRSKETTASGKRY
eukprot:gnl/MRDRNA2_/MRDRNA2_75731_c0_seq2.p1 gnl/MRDRNA2_/MRDRNA2_75731_c0~~gnl/MRDRNA2_/MRDRNA2_75731_c0_seq2.p1  ORF type:complete len:168 (+),score=40.98 gnl/MRDRNA2_/MRDRNA2_75731_c0_seq2:215-718(+)